MLIKLLYMAAGLAVGIYLRGLLPSRLERAINSALDAGMKVTIALGDTAMQYEKQDGKLSIRYGRIETRELEENE